MTLIPGRVTLYHVNWISRFSQNGGSPFYHGFQYSNVGWLWVPPKIIGNIHICHTYVFQTLSFFLVWARSIFLIPNGENSCNRRFLFFLGFAVLGGSISCHLRAFAHPGPCAPLHISFLQQMSVQQVGQLPHPSFERYLAWQRCWIFQQLAGRIGLGWGEPHEELNPSTIGAWVF